MINLISSFHFFQKGLPHLKIKRLGNTLKELAYEELFLLKLKKTL